MKIVRCETIPQIDNVYYRRLKRGDMFGYRNNLEAKMRFYIKTNDLIAVDLMTGETTTFYDDPKVTPFEMEATLKRCFGNCINDNCEYFHLRAFDNEPCKSCSRNYSDKYEKKREEIADEDID